MSLSSLTLFEDVSLGGPWRWWWSSPPPGRGVSPPGRCWGCRWGCPWTWRPTGSPCTPWPTACPAWRRGAFRLKSRLRAAPGLCAGQRGSGPLDLGQGAAHLHPVRGVSWGLWPSSSCPSGPCGGWRPGCSRSRRGPSRRTAGPKAGSSAAWRRPPRPSAPCTTPCVPPSGRPRTTTTWPPSSTGRPVRCAAPAPAGQLLGAGLRVHLRRPEQRRPAHAGPGQGGAGGLSPALCQPVHPLPRLSSGGEPGGHRPALPAAVQQPHSGQPPGGVPPVRGALLPPGPGGGRAGGRSSPPTWRRAGSCASASPPRGTDCGGRPSGTAAAFCA